jgi:vacuolar-type H+-ATPase subunit I/STV1
MGKTEKVREILRNIGIEIFDVFMTDEAKKQKEIEKYNKRIDELDIEITLGE